jgi:hypothetical protein
MTKRSEMEFTQTDVLVDLFPGKTRGSGMNKDRVLVKLTVTTMHL